MEKDLSMTLYDYLVEEVKQGDKRVDWITRIKDEKSYLFTGMMYEIKYVIAVDFTKRITVLHETLDKDKKQIVLTVRID